MLTKLFAALMTVILCLGASPVLSTQTEQAMPAKHLTAIEAANQLPEEASSLLTEEEALAFALSHAQLTRDDISVLRTKLDWDDGRQEWEVDFRSGDWEYDYTIHAETGDILEWDKEYEPKRTSPTRPETTQPPETEPATQPLTKEDAQAIALAHAELTAEQVSRLRVTSDRDDGVSVYDVEFRCGRWEYEYEIHAETGRILDWEKDYDD